MALFFTNNSLLLNLKAMTELKDSYKEMAFSLNY